MTLRRTLRRKYKNWSFGTETPKPEYIYGSMFEAIAQKQNKKVCEH